MLNWRSLGPSSLINEYILVCFIAKFRMTSFSVIHLYYLVKNILLSNSWSIPFQVNDDYIIRADNYITFNLLANESSKPKDNVVIIRRWIKTFPVIAWTFINDEMEDSTSQH